MLQIFLKCLLKITFLGLFMAKVRVVFVFDSWGAVKNQKTLEIEIQEGIQTFSKQRFKFLLSCLVFIIWSTLTVPSKECSIINVFMIRVPINSRRTFLFRNKSRHLLCGLTLQLQNWAWFDPIYTSVAKHFCCSTYTCIFPLLGEGGDKCILWLSFAQQQVAKLQMLTALWTQTFHFFFVATHGKAPPTESLRSTSFSHRKFKSMQA
jgi:hypothetical protein